jgi:RHS repeat-associated protein
VEVEPFGLETNRSFDWNGVNQKRKFTTYDRDANGGDEAMFRRYAPKQDRFAQPDPYDGSYSLANPQSLNRYAYTQGDPVNFVDPLGLLISVVCRTYDFAVNTSETQYVFSVTSCTIVEFGGNGGGSLPIPGYIGPSIDDDGFPGGSPNPKAQLGPCHDLVVPDFDALAKTNPSAATLLQNTYGKDAKSAYEKLSIYEKAVLLNTAAAANSVGTNLSNAKLDGFYLSDKPGNLPYGIYVTGARGKTEGRHKDIASVELDTKKGRTQIDVDLFRGTKNLFSPLAAKHREEGNFNSRHNRPTHPGDVTAQLAARGVNSGVNCKN